MLIQLYRLNSFLSKTSSTEIQNASSELESLKTDLNEIREYLLLPTNKEDSTVTTKELSVDQVIANSLQELQKQQDQEKIQANYLVAYKQATTLLQNTDISPTVIIEEGTITTVDGVYSFGIENQKLFINDSLLVQYYSSTKLEDFYTAVKKVNAKYLQDLQIKIKSAQNAKDVLINFEESLGEVESLLMDRQLKVLYSPEKQYELNIFKADNSLALKLKYNLKDSSFQLFDAKNQAVGAKSQDFANQIANLETHLKLNSFETLIQKNVQEKLAEIQSSLNSAEFKKKLENLNAKVEVTNANESEYHISIVDNVKNEVLLRYIISKNTAEVFYEFNQIRKKLSFKNSQSLAKSSNVKNFLIAGKHGSLTDTLILANLNEANGSVSLLSIPRDLYIDGRKINSIYASDGLAALEQNIESITGQEIDNHILIDMYAFIDVVDYLGGVTVNLAEPIMDPTYKTFDNGVWSTMYFSAGEHTLNGKQALRLARSRFTSSDFDRAARQQLILGSLKDKLANLQLGNAKAIAQIGLTMLGKTETDLPLHQAVGYFLKYRNFDIASQSVLSTANILVSTYSNLYNDRQCANCGKGGYILVPQNNDWSILKTYVSSVFSG